MNTVPFSFDQDQAAHDIEMEEAVARAEAYVAQMQDTWEELWSDVE